VILEVSGQSVKKPSEFVNLLNEARSEGKNRVLMRVKSGTATRFLVVPTG
jgi:hypothetical protein